MSARHCERKVEERVELLIQVPQSLIGYISQGHSSSPLSPSFSPAVHALLVVVCDERTPGHLQFVA